MPEPKKKITIEVDDGTAIILISAVGNKENADLIGLGVSYKHVYGGDINESSEQRFLFAVAHGVVDLLKNEPEPVIQHGFQVASRIWVPNSYGGQPSKQLDLEFVDTKGTA